MIVCKWKKSSPTGSSQYANTYFEKTRISGQLGGVQTDVLTSMKQK
jgi:hypothetical protein